MGSRFLKVLVGLGVVAAMLVATGSGSNKVRNGGTIVFGSASDPVVLDGALVSDGESLRADRPDLRGARRAEARLDADQAAAGDELACRARTGSRGRSRCARASSFQDGTRFNAAAVCLQLQPLVQLPEPAPEHRRDLLLEHGLRRLRASGAGQPGAGQEPVQGLQGEGPEPGDHPASTAGRRRSSARSR